jgi:uncharacterized membrane protein
MPRNNVLVKVDPEAPDARRQWRRHLAEWTAGNHLRTLAPLVAAHSRSKESMPPESADDRGTALVTGAAVLATGLLAGLYNAFTQSCPASPTRAFIDASRARRLHSQPAT